MNVWNTVALGDATTILGGGTPTRNNPHYYGGDIPWVTPKDMKTREIYGAQINLTQSGVDNSATRMVPPNSVLLVVRSGVLKHTIPVALNRIPVAINQDMKALVCRDGLDSNFLAHFVKAQSPTILKWVRATTADNFPIDLLRKLQIPLPSVAEQRRIAQLLDRAEALRAKRRAALTQLDTLTQSIFLEMFEDKKLASVELQQLCELVTDGTHYTPEYAQEGVIFLSAKNVTSGYVDWQNVKFIPQSLHRELQKRVSPQRNDILLAKNGTTGIAAIVDRDCIFDIYVSLALLRPKSDVLPVYLHSALNSFNCRKQFHGALKGIGVPNLHLNEIRKASIPKPPLSMQRNFAVRVSTLEKLKKNYRSSLSEFDAMFSTIQHRAFRGEL